MKEIDMDNRDRIVQKLNTIFETQFPQDDLVDHTSETRKVARVNKCPSCAGDGTACDMSV